MAVDEQRRDAGPVATLGLIGADLGLENAAAAIAQGRYDDARAAAVAAEEAIVQAPLRGWSFLGVLVTALALGIVAVRRWRAALPQSHDGVERAPA